MRFSFPHSHAFNRGRVSVEDDGAPGPECTVEFGDGSIVIGTCAAAGEAYALSVPQYRTARGTTIQAKDWRLVRSADGSWRSLRTG